MSRETTALSREAEDTAVTLVGAEDARRKQDPSRCPRKSELAARRMALTLNVAGRDIALLNARVSTIPTVLLTRLPSQKKPGRPGYSPREVAGAAIIEDHSVATIPILESRLPSLSTRTTRDSPRPSWQKNN